MAPRNPGVIISTLLETEEEEKNNVENFCNVATELYTHPKDEISKLIIRIKDKDIFSIRESLFLRCYQGLSQKFLENKIHINENEPITSLRKRYKVDKVYDDIFILSMSLIEQKLHKDISKTVVSTPQTPAVNTSNTGEPVFTAAESAIIAELHNIRDGMKEIRRENKELKEKINLANTKIDKYEELLESQNLKISELIVYIKKNSSEAASVAEDKEGNDEERDEERINSSRQEQDATSTSSELGSGHGGLGSAIANARFINRGLDNRNSNGNFEKSSNDKESNRRGDGSGSTTGRHQLTSSVPQQLQQNPNYDATRAGNIRGNVDSDGYEMVGPRKRKPVYGTKAATASGSSVGIVGERSKREFSLFVGGLRKNLRCEDLSKHIQEDLHITTTSVEINKTNNYNRSFKITVQYKDKDIMFTPANWEENIIIKPFRVRRENAAS